MVRGNERRAIFMDDLDRARFLFRLEGALAAAGTECFAWALMPNHAHLLLRTGTTPLAVAMHRLGTSYAMDFNARHGRVGHLFQNRYKALPVESDAYLLELIRYIHLNPVRAGIVPDLDALEFHPWTGHRVLMGRGRAPFQSVEGVLAEFSRDPREARVRLREWMGALPAGPEREGDSGCAAATPEDTRQAGPQVPPSASGARSPRPPRPSAGGLCPRSSRGDVLRQEGWDLDRLSKFVCGAMEVAEQDLRSGRRLRRVSGARAVIAWLAWSGLGVSLDRIGSHLGVGPSSLSERMDLGRRLAGEGGIDPFGDILRRHFSPGVPPGSYPQTTE